MVHNKNEAKSINNDDVDEDHHLDVVFSCAFFDGNVLDDVHR